VRDAGAPQHPADAAPACAFRAARLRCEPAGACALHAARGLRALAHRAVRLALVHPRPRPRRACLSGAPYLNCERRHRGCELSADGARWVDAPQGDVSDEYGRRDETCPVSTQGKGGASARPRRQTAGRVRARAYPRAHVRARVGAQVGSGQITFRAAYRPSPPVSPVLSGHAASLTPY
jgi:hypothetical protein